MSSVCVLGSFMMDLAVCAPRRPAPGETVVGTGFDMFLGGKGFNQAVAASRAGATTGMIGRLGDDEFGRQFLERLRTEAIDATHVIVDEQTGTGIGVPLVEASGENSIVIVPRANQQMTPTDIERSTPSIESARVLLLQLELPVDTAFAAARIAKRSGALVVLNPAPAPDADVIDEFRGLIDVLVVNEVEAHALCGATVSSDSSRLGAELARLAGAPVVMTLGSQGCLVASKQSSFAIAAHRVDVVDTVGAGDAFCGAMGAWLSAGADLDDAVVYANAAGALAVTCPGAEPAMPRREAIIELAERSQPIAAALSGRPATP